VKPAEPRHDVVAVPAEAAPIRLSNIEGSRGRA
jgi:hypothetical protein